MNVIMYRENLAQGEYYHIYNRGVNKQNIFDSDRDRIRFLFNILQFQYSSTSYNIERQVDSYVKHRMFNIRRNGERKVELVSFCLMPNHFHMLVFEKKAGGISKYMQRTLNSYTKFINTKYHKSGHLFEGPYKSVHVKDNRQLLHLSAYIHRNPVEISDWSKRIDKYPWSSLQDYLNINRWGEDLKAQIVLDQFPSKDYEEFIETSPAKALKESGVAID